MTASRHGGSDDGAVAVTVAITLVLMFGMVAVVIDLGMLRLDRRNDQRTSDVAAVAGAISLGQGSPTDGCNAAVDYVLLNLPDAGPASPADPCAAWPNASSPCPGTPEVAQITAGDYAIEVVWPVVDGALLMEGRLHTTDGDACDRIGVSVQRGRDFTFAPVMGLARGGTTADAVARAAFGNTSGQIASLVVLDDVGCEALLARGNGRIHVREVHDWLDPDTGELRDLPGIISVDSAASAGCAGDAPAIESEGESSDIRAGGLAGDTNESDDLGVILSYALQAGSGPAFDTRDVNQGRLSPEPVGGERVTRVVADDRWGSAVAALAARVGTSGAPTGFSIYTGPCTITGTVTLSGDTWVGCNTLTIEPRGTLVLQDGNLVTDGPIVVKGEMTVNSPPTDPHWVVIRDGDLEKFSQASLTLDEVFVLPLAGRIKLEGGDQGSLTWTAPESAGSDFDLEDLAMWSESSAIHRLAGQAALVLEGVWFAPNATPFEFAGGNLTTTTVFQTKAQFITWRFDVSGNGELVMEPDPERNLEIPLTGVSLIR